MKGRRRQQAGVEFPSSFLPGVAKAADREMEEVLTEDALMRLLGIPLGDREDHRDVR